MIEFDQKNIPLTLMQVEFNFPWFGVDSIICHHIDQGESWALLHFTKNVSRLVPTEYIKSFKTIENPLP